MNPTNTVSLPLITDILNFLHQASKGHVVSLLEDIIYHGVSGHGDIATPTQLVVQDIPRSCFTVLREKIRFVISNETIWSQEFDRAILRLKEDLEKSQRELAAFENAGSQAYYATAEKILNTRRELEMLLQAVQETKRIHVGVNYDQQWSIAGMVNGFIVGQQFIGLMGTGGSTSAFAADVDLHFVDLQSIKNIRSIQSEEVLQICTNLPVSIFTKYFCEDFPTGNLAIRKETQGDVILIAKNDTSLVVPRSSLRLYCNPEFHTIDRTEHLLNTELTQNVAEFLGVILTACNYRRLVPEFTAEEVAQFMAVKAQLGFNFEQ